MSKVFGLGLSRTGTTTFSEVLKPHLKIVHYPRTRDLQYLNNDGACDIPVIPEYKNLDERVEDAKFVLTTRDIDEWVVSVSNYFERKRKRTPNPTGWQAEIRKKVYGELFPSPEQLRDVYINHYNDVTQHFQGREDKLLILNIVGGDSPEKLFTFLGLDNPPAEFPKTNQAKK